MTHDELLQDLNTWVRFSACNNKGKEWVKALRAVVELHKPVKKPYMPLFCAECDGYADYPCATIQAITKELQ